MCHYLPSGSAPSIAVSLAECRNIQANQAAI